MYIDIPILWWYFYFKMFISTCVELDMTPQNLNSPTRLRWLNICSCFHSCLSNFWDNHLWKSSSSSHVNKLVKQLKRNWLSYSHKNCEHRILYLFQTIYDVFLDLSILLIIVGGVIFIVGFSGFVGALRENLCFLRIVSLSIQALNVLRNNFIIKLFLVILCII